MGTVLRIQAHRHEAGNGSGKAQKDGRFDELAILTQCPIRDSFYFYLDITSVHCKLILVH